MLRRIDIVGNPNVGVFIQATDDYAIVPYNLIDEKVKLVEEILEVPAVKSSVSGSSLIGSLSVANSKGIVVRFLQLRKFAPFCKITPFSNKVLKFKYISLLVLLFMIPLFNVPLSTPFLP